MCKLYFVLLVCLILTLHAGLHAQWISSFGNIGNGIGCIVASDTNLFAGGYGVFLSTNNGKSWTAVNSGLPADCMVQAIAVNGPNIFIATGSENLPCLFRSTNNGTSWTKLDYNYSFFYITSFAFIGTNIFAGSFEGGVFLSTDNGTSWTPDTTSFPKDPHGYLQIVNVLAASGNNLFAGTGYSVTPEVGGVFLSTDNGVSWSATSLMNTSVTNLVVTSNGTGGTNIFATTMSDTGNYGHIYLSNDNGASWTEVDSGLTNTWVRSLIAVPNGTGSINLFAGTSGEGVFLSTDNGTSWKSIGLSHTHITALASASNGTGRTKLFAGNFSVESVATTSGNIFFSTDNGTTWTITTLYSTINTFALSPNGTGGANMFAVASNVFLSSTNNGASWTATGLPNENFNALAVSPLFGGIGGTNIFVGTGTYGNNGLVNEGVFLSTNNGSSWTAALDSGLANAYVNFLAVTPNGVGDTILFAGTISDASGLITGNGIFRSTNYGTSWIRVPNLPSSTITSFVISGTNQYFGTNGAGVFLSTDNDSSWNAVNTGLTNLKINVLAVYDTNLFAGTKGNGVFLSTNNGTSWHATGLKKTDVRAFAVWPNGSGGTNLFAGTSSGGVFLSTDNGVTWNAANTGLSNLAINSIIINGKDIFAGTGDGIWRRSLSEMTTGIKENPTEMPIHFVLSQNYPNPFNPTTTISFDLPTKSFVSLKVFDILGKEVVTILSEELSSGSYTRQWNAANMSSGVYFYRLKAGSFVETKKLILLR